MSSNDTTMDDSCGSGDTSKSESSLDSRMAQAKRVSWDKIHIREFALVVGDHPLCNDGLPVSLGWQYNDSRSPNSLTEARNVSERKQSYAFPRRLSYDERRHRLCLGGLSAEQVRNDEIDLVVRTLNEAWDHDDPCDPLADFMTMDDDIPRDMDFDLLDISEFKWTD